MTSRLVDGVTPSARVGSRSTRSVGVVLTLAFVLAGSGPAARMQQPAQTLDLPARSRDAVQSLARGESHAWRVDLASAEYLEIAVEPQAPGDSDEWPSMTVLSPAAVNLPWTVTHCSSSSGLEARKPRARISNSPEIRPCSEAVMVTQPVSPWKKPRGCSTAPATRHGWNQRSALRCSGKAELTR